MSTRLIADRKIDLSNRGRNVGLHGLWLLLGSSLYLYLSLFSFRSTPFLLGGDQVFFWMDAQRLLLGKHIYRDFFQFTPPGTDIVCLCAFRLFGPRIWVTNVVVLLLGILLCWVCFRISLSFLELSHALLASALFLVLIYGKMLNATHHWFSELAVLAAVAVLMPRRSGTRIVLAGLLLGIAAFFTQSRGPAGVLGIAAFLFWERMHAEESWPSFFKRVALLFAFFLIAWVSLSGYFIATAGLRQMWYWQVSYASHVHFSGGGTLGLPGGSSGSLPSYIQAVIVYLLLPVVYAISLWDAWKERHNLPAATADRRLLLTLVGFATGLEVALNPNWLRVYCVAAPGSSCWFGS